MKGLSGDSDQYLQVGRICMVVGDRRVTEYRGRGILYHSLGNGQWATQLKFVCPRMSHCASHYYNPSQPIACCGQKERWTGWWQPVNCMIIGRYVALLSDSTVHSLYCGLYVLFIKRVLLTSIFVQYTDKKMDTIFSETFRNGDESFLQRLR